MFPIPGLSRLFRALTDLAGLLDVEPVGDEGEVGVQGAEGLRHVLLDVVSRVEDDLHPATRGSEGTTLTPGGPCL